MNNLLTALFFQVAVAMSSVKGFISNEAKRLKDDERGIELVTIVIIILIVVVLAAAIWAFLGDWIGELLRQIFESDPVGAPEDIWP